MRFSIPWVSMILVTSSPRILTMVLMVFFISSSSSSIRRCMCGNNGFNRPTVLLSLCYDKFIHVKNLRSIYIIPTGSSFTMQLYFKNYVKLDLLDLSTLMKISMYILLPMISLLSSSFILIKEYYNKTYNLI